ncbi:MAG: hypothetical protein ACTSU5_14845 [Promethearchaeota archaeon]
MSDSVNVRTSSKKFHRKYGKVAVLEMIERDPFVPDALQEELKEKLPKQRVITPQELARRHGITVSAAKKLLRKFEELGVVKFHSGSRRLKVYTGAAASK